jgi:hypothetical protein
MGWTPEAVITELAAIDERWRSRFASATEAALRHRPEPAVWSAVEYTVHTARITEIWHVAVQTAVAGDEFSWPREYPDADKEPFNAVPPADALADLCRELRALGEWASAEWDVPLVFRDADLTERFRRYGIGNVRAGLLHPVHDARHHHEDIVRGLA